MFIRLLLTVFLFTRVLSLDIVVSGNYVIEQCGKQAGVVKASLDDTYNYLQKIIRFEDGTSAPYKAFLDGVDLGETKALFSRIMAGRNITLSSTSYRPVIVCITARSSGFWNYCRDNSNFTGFHLRGTHFVMLCPLFFRDLNPWPVPRDCNVVNSRNTQLSGPLLSATRYTSLVHELVHMYLGKPGLRPEVYRTNACLKLSSEKAAINPNNYALYAGSECSETGHAISPPQAWPVFPYFHVSHPNHHAAYSTDFFPSEQISRPPARLSPQRSSSSNPTANFSKWIPPNKTISSRSEVLAQVKLLKPSILNPCHLAAEVPDYEPMRDPLERPRTRRWLQRISLVSLITKSSWGPVLRSQAQVSIEALYPCRFGGNPKRKHDPCPR